MAELQRIAVISIRKVREIKTLFMVRELCKANIVNYTITLQTTK